MEDGVGVGGNGDGGTENLRNSERKLFQMRGVFHIASC